jgi:hypothetical protein
VLALIVVGVVVACGVLAIRGQSADWALVGLTFVLVMVTAAYVVLTWRLTNEARLARLAEQERWRLDRLHQPARAALEVVRRAQDDLAGDEDYRAKAGRFASALNEHIPFLEEVVRGRVEFCKEVARVSSFPDHEFGSIGLARIAARGVRDQTRWSLEAYLAGRQLPTWVDGNGAPLPQGNDFAWLINISKRPPP